MFFATQPLVVALLHLLTNGTLPLPCNRLRFFRAISTETLTAENWSSARWLKWNGVSLTALIARDFESFAFSARSP